MPDRRRPRTRASRVAPNDAACCARRRPTSPASSRRSVRRRRNSSPRLGADVLDRRLGGEPSRRSEGAAPLVLLLSVQDAREIQTRARGRRATLARPAAISGAVTNVGGTPSAGMPDRLRERADPLRVDEELDGRVRLPREHQARGSTRAHPAATPGRPRADGGSGSHSRRSPVRPIHIAPARCERSGRMQGATTWRSFRDSGPGRHLRSAAPMAGDGNGAGHRERQGQRQRTRPPAASPSRSSSSTTSARSARRSRSRWPARRTSAIVHVATDGPEGVRAAGRHHPDVVLMDVSMPGMSGIEATRRIKEVDPDAAIADPVRTRRRAPARAGGAGRRGRACSARPRRS